MNLVLIADSSMFHPEIDDFLCAATQKQNGVLHFTQSAVLFGFILWRVVMINCSALASVWRLGKLPDVSFNVPSARLNVPLPGTKSHPR
jgi:hypothetical protein